MAPARAGGNGAERLSVVVADDDAFARTMICEVIQNADTLELVGVAEDADSAIALVADRAPDVVVLDWMMPRGGGPEASRQIEKRFPRTAIVALTASETNEATSDMLFAGAKSVLSKRTPADQIVRAIQVAPTL